MYIKEGIIHNKLGTLDLGQQVQILPIEINIRKQKWLLLPIYRPPTQNRIFFMNNIARMVDNYFANIENILIIGDFNMEVHENDLAQLSLDYNLYSLLKSPTCFKTVNGRCIDLMLTNKKHSFFQSQSFETGFSDHHPLIYTILKSTFVKVPPKVITYRDYKTFNTERFLTDLNNVLSCSFSAAYSSFETNFLNTLELHAPSKKRMVRGNDKQHMNKSLRKAIMLRSRLKNRANRTGNEEDIKKYKKQPNLVAKLNRASKCNFFKKLEPTNVENDRKFWKAVKPLFSNTDPMSNKIIFVEDCEILQEETRVAEILNSYFLTITDTLGLDPFFKDTGQNETVDQMVNQAVEKYKNHNSILRIKEKTKNFPSFGFTHVNPWEVSEQIDALNTKKASSGGIPSKVLKMSKKAICPHPTDCINTSSNDCVFPEELKAATVSPVFKNKESYLKSNYRPISVLPSVSKILKE